MPLCSKGIKPSIRKFLNRISRRDGWSCWGFHRLAMSFSLVFRFLFPSNLLWYSSICPLNVVIAASTKSSHHGICGFSYKTNALTAKAKTNKNRNEQILRNAEDAVRREETEDSHKCQRKEGQTKMKISYKTATLSTVEAEDYYQ